MADEGDFFASSTKPRRWSTCRKLSTPQNREHEKRKKKREKEKHCPRRDRANPLAQHPNTITSALICVSAVCISSTCELSPKFLVFLEPRHPAFSWPGDPAATSIKTDSRTSLCSSTCPLPVDLRFLHLCRGASPSSLHHSIRLVTPPSTSAFSIPTGPKMPSNLPSSFASAAAGQNARSGARADGRGSFSGEWYVLAVLPSPNQSLVLSEGRGKPLSWLVDALCSSSLRPRCVSLALRPSVARLSSAMLLVPKSWSRHR